MVTGKNPRLRGYSILSVTVLSILIFSCKDLVEPKTAPTVLTGEITNGTATSATVSGQIVDDGNANVSERGVVIGKNADPSINDTKVVSGNGEGTFTVDLSGLTAAVSGWFF